MNWEWILLLCILTTVCSLDPPKDLRQTPSSVPTKPNKKSNKAIHKNTRNTDHPTTSATKALHEAAESIFPDVIYPTSILEVSQPFYYSQPGKDVLGPFSNDVKSSYKTLNSGKEKSSTDISSTRQEKNDVSENVTVDHENYSNVLASNEFLAKNMSMNTEIVENTCNIEDIVGQIGGYDNEQLYVNNGLLETVLQDTNIVHENMSCNDIGEHMEHTHENPKSFTNVYDLVIGDPTQELLENNTQIDPINSNKTYHVHTNPNYVMTSDTGNTHEDFVNDILNIYSLIEESIRAISVVEFVVSKTLGALGIDDKRNEMIVPESINDSLNATDDLHDDNGTTLYNSNRSKEILSEEILIDQMVSALSEINDESGSKVEILRGVVPSDDLFCKLFMDFFMDKQ